MRGENVRGNASSAPIYGTASSVWMLSDCNAARRRREEYRLPFGPLNVLAIVCSSKLLNSRSASFDGVAVLQGFDFAAQPRGIAICDMTIGLQERRFCR